jgi:hypothetical protein
MTQNSEKNMKSNKKTKQIAGILLIIAAIGTISWTAVNILDETDTYLSAAPTTIEFKQTEIDMGNLKQGHPQTATFEFQNTGSKPLIIQQVETSCGCTEPTWPKRPIKPGQLSELKVTYDAKHPGRFVKSITVFCNSDKGIEKLVVKGTVDGNESLVVKK